MAVLLLGATGFIGSRVVRALETRGVEIAAVSRTGDGPHGVALDRRDADRVRVLVRDRRIDTVIDLLAYVEADTIPLFAALDGEVGRWVMASSCDVYRNYEGLTRKAEPDPIVGPLTEQSPLRITRYPYRQEPRRSSLAEDAFWDDYDKIPLEQALRSRPGLSSVILRLPMVFGPGDLQRRFRWIVEPMIGKRKRLAVDTAWAKWRTIYGYVDDVAHAIVTAATHPAAVGHTFNLGQEGAPDHLAWIARFAGFLGWQGEVELTENAPISPLAGLDFRYSLAIDTRAFRAVCDWREPTSLNEALDRTSAYEMQAV